MVDATALFARVKQPGSVGETRFPHLHNRLRIRITVLSLDVNIARAREGLGWLRPPKNNNIFMLALCASRMAPDVNTWGNPVSPYPCLWGRQPLPTAIGKWGNRVSPYPCLWGPQALPSARVWEDAALTGTSVFMLELCDAAVWTAEGTLAVRPATRLRGWIWEGPSLPIPRRCLPAPGSPPGIRVAAVARTRETKHCQPGGLVLR